ncbi:MAG: hypothetical protein WC302_01485 [Candidatus Paceibacterota bacterium]|jgi:hypothetical protein
MHQKFLAENRSDFYCPDPIHYWNHSFVTSSSNNSLDPCFCEIGSGCGNFTKANIMNSRFILNELDILRDGRLNLTPNNFSGLATSTKDNQWYLVDACISTKISSSYNLDKFYTTSGAARESSYKLAKFLPPENTYLDSLTSKYFGGESGVATLTSPYGEIGSVLFEKVNNGTTCSHGHSITVKLTNIVTGESVALCNKVFPNSKHDLEQAVWALAFHTSCSMITEDRCLGEPFSGFNSFCPSRNVFWKNNINI